MLTHTIRAFTLLALIVVAHMLRPFSMGNVIVFTDQAVSSVAHLLPEKTLERWQDFGLLAALVTGNSDPFTSRFANVGENVMITRLNNYEPGKPVKQIALMTQTGRTARRFERTAFGQGRRSNNFGGVPMPFIPDLESSLISNPSLMAFPPVITVQGLELPARTSGLGVSGLQQQLDNFVREEEAVSEETSWFLETVVQKPVPATIPNLTLRMFAPIQRANSNAFACPQPAKNTKGIVSTKGQSC
jgi:hypothetical protein